MHPGTGMRSYNVCHTHTHTQTYTHMTWLSIAFYCFYSESNTVFNLHQTHKSSQWIQTQWMKYSYCLGGTEWLLTLAESSDIPIIQRDLIVGLRCCAERVCGRAYWEIEWSGSAGVGISLSYRSICRKGRGDECKFGCNDQSMNLYCSPSKYIFWDNNKKTKLYVNTSKLKSSRLGVYVDYSAGIVNYFSISDKMKLIYIFQGTFTQPIYPGFMVYFGSAVKLCDPAMNCRWFRDVRCYFLFFCQ